MFFKPKEVKWALAALEARVAHSAFLRSEPELLKATKALLGRVSWSKKFIDEKKLTPETLVAFTISELLSSILRKGTMHVYRGVLSDRGKAMKANYELCIDELHRAEVYDEDDADHWKDWLSRELEKVG